jgi:hypothetical protein
MGSWYSVHGNLSVTGYFFTFFADLCNFLRHFLSLRTIAQSFGLLNSLQFWWLYKGHSGYCFDISISWVFFRIFEVDRITLLNYDKRKCNIKSWYDNRGICGAEKERATQALPYKGSPTCKYIDYISTMWCVNMNFKSFMSW